MTKSFFNGISGMKTFQSGIDIWGNNISNINTIGYKETEAEFSSIFAESIKNSPITSDIGFGSKLEANAINTSQGSLINSDNPFNIALEGKGWFAVKKGNETFYTRNGNFKKDGNGYLVDDNGNYLLVANANNIVNKNGAFEINPNISTKDLINNPLSPIMLTENLIFPSIATSKIDFYTNLNNTEKILTSAPADLENDFSALYSSEGMDLKIRDGDSFVFGIGNSITYSNNSISTEICITDDKKDGKNLDFDFTINNKNIKLELEDGSTKEEIQNALVDKLKENGINAIKSKNGIIISNPEKIILKSQNNNLPNISAEKLTYNSNPTKENEFNTIQSLTQKLNNLASNENLTVSFENGKIKISNQTSNSFKTYVLKTENSNELFIDNLKSLENTISSNSSITSSIFKANRQIFEGDIIDTNGNKTPLKFIFTKQKVYKENTIWNLKIKDSNDNLVKSENFTFDNIGKLLSPTSTTINSPQNIKINFNLTSYNKFENNYNFSQNGVEKGELKQYFLDENGIIFAHFSNQKSVAVGQIPIFHFQNPQGLENVGGNIFKETLNSNKAFLYKDKNGNYIPYAKILPNKLESSNVNFAKAMTELIVTQKAFSAAAKTVTTSDEMIQKAINLKRG